MLTYKNRFIPMTTMLCGKPTKGTGRPCRSRTLPDLDHCRWHRPKCQGLKKDGTRCEAPAKCEHDWEYCRHSHYPGTTCTDPGVFRLPNLAKNTRSVVKEYRGGKDAYTNQGSLEFQRHEMDHVVEIHIARDAFDKIQKHGNGFHVKQKMLQDDIASVINMTENLNLTTKDINNVKFRGFDAFQEKYKSGCESDIEPGIVHFLREAKSDQNDRKLTRTESKAIQKEVAKSFYAIMDKMEQEHTLHEEWCTNLHRNVIAMKILGSN